MTSMTDFVTTEQGSSIAFDSEGSGPPVILVGGAFQHRAIDAGTRELTTELAGRGLTAVHYDRPGRGETKAEGPFGLESQLDALRALLERTGPAALYGSSSGGAIALAAAAHGLPVTKLALWETPLGVELGTDGPSGLATFRSKLASSDGEEVVTYFMRDLVAPNLGGLPPGMLEGLKQSPDWPMMVGVGPSLEGDTASLAWTQSAPRSELFAPITVPVLVILCEQSLPVMERASVSIRAALPQAREVRVPGANHQWELPGLVSALQSFLSA
jgi:pimeloyl-ACP methyl ester carboxylesterase